MPPPREELLVGQDAGDTTLLMRLKAGRDEAAAQEIWARYFERLAALARRKLKERRVSDEEDVALSALNSFFRGVENGRFPRLDDRQDLWQVLVMLTERKAISQLRRYLAAKRGGRRVRGDSAFDNPADPAGSGGIHRVASPEPTPEFASLFTDECRRLFGLLADPELKLVALLRMEGFTTPEIGRSLDRAPRSIERKLQMIRNIWENQAEA
jgi:DNA-directed RNA polymerase specialized sigma24 family protein